jgi:hypothetical protein
VAQISQAIINDGERLVFPQECSDHAVGGPLWTELVAIAGECFAADPALRPTAAAVAARLMTKLNEVCR